jgi:hypothetical protein
MWARLLLTLLFSALLVSCGGQNTPAAQVTPLPPSPQPTAGPTDPFFPQQTQPHTYDTFDGLGGQLVLVDNCLRLSNTHRGSFLIIWPYRYHIDRSSNPVQIYDDTGQVVANLGDYIEIQGGEVSSWSPLPVGCSGPYWYMQSSPPSHVDVHFPQAWPLVLDPPTNPITGKLISVNDCLRLQLDEKRSFLLIWPVFISIDREKDPVQVYSTGLTRVAIGVGEEITAAGREILPDKLSDYTFYPIPNECAGPYWGVNDIEK